VERKKLKGDGRKRGETKYRRIKKSQRKERDERIHEE
jgi:hypothetical protein